MVTWLGSDGYGVGRPVDLRSVAPAGAAWAAALAAPLLPPWAAWSLGALAGSAAVLVFLLARAPTEALALTAAAALACAGTVAVVAGVQVHRVADGAARAAVEAGEVEFTAVVSGDPRARAGVPRPGRAEWVIRARATRVDGRAAADPVVLLASGDDWAGLLPGQSLTARGGFTAAEDDPFLGALVLVRGPPREVAPPDRWQGFAGGVRAGLREAAAGLTEPERGLLPALIVGDTSGVDARVAEDFRATGMTHLLTVSGANLAILTGVVVALGRLVRAPPWWTVAGGAVMIWLFVLVCRPEPSVVRAAFMGSLALLALATGRAHMALGALGVTVVGVLFAAPALASSYGFALSVLATAGIVLLVPRWTREWSASLPAVVAEALAVAVAAHLAVSPVVVTLSGEVSWVAVPANVLAAPVVAAVTVLGSAVTALAAVAPGAAAVLAVVPGWGVAWIAAVAGAGARVPYGALPWRPDLAGALLLAALAVALVVSRGRARRLLAAGAVAVLVLAAAARCLPGGWPPRDWAVAACDVGQGSAFVLSVAPGSAVVADAGQHPEAVDACLERLGVREVPLLVLSHDHADHVDGVPGVLRHRRVDRALVPPGFDAAPVGGLLAGAGVERLGAERGAALRVGPWTLRVLWPPPGYRGSVNDGSVVVRADSPHLSVLLPGDVEEEAQRGMLALGEPLAAAVLAVPHHGSAAQVPEFLEATGARIALTSVGADNPYGHPAPFTQSVLRRMGALDLRTDLAGDIAVVGSGEGPTALVRGPDRAGARRRSVGRGMLVVCLHPPRSRSSSATRSSSSTGPSPPSWRPSAPRTRRWTCTTSSPPRWVRTPWWRSPPRRCSATAGWSCCAPPRTWSRTWPRR
ncbi:competence protein ComEC [Nocardiopsis flavescens]|uniref:Competence protein ComEC n=1 Tax=Nocardiopsis flavescens TaxID=758803 RepID=A0A1M6EB94_9ACTN|nr:competence protein ComEC [Nocardiopsis flavescens]